MITNTNLSIISSSVQVADNSIRDRQIEPQEPISAVDSAGIEPEVVADKPEEENHEKGVLRLLREGHFKGVSDVRLRINFHDEISATEQKQSAFVAEEKVTGLIESIDNNLENFLQIPGLNEQMPSAIENLSQEFNTNVSHVLDDFLTAETPNKDNLISQLQSSFDELKSGLESVFDENAAPIIEESTDNTVQNDLYTGTDVYTTPNENNVELPIDTPPTLFGQFLAQLIDSFTTGLSNLETALKENNVLPDISAPHGDGRAYDKFLAVYNELKGDVQGKIDSPTINTLT